MALQGAFYREVVLKLKIKITGGLDKDIARSQSQSF